MAFTCIYAVRECTGCGGCAPSPRLPRCDGCGRTLVGVDSMEIGGRVLCDDCIHARYGAETERDCVGDDIYNVPL